MKILILTTNLNPGSRSLVLAERAHEVCIAAGADACLIDLQELDLPFCGTSGAAGHPHVVQLRERVHAADGILIVTPVYNYHVNAAAKNAIELTGTSWENKVVGFICAAGGAASYMAVMSFANSLMLDFRCLIVPRFVYVTVAAVEDGQIVDDEIERRIAQLCEATMQLADVWPVRG